MAMTIYEVIKADIEKLGRIQLPVAVLRTTGVQIAEVLDDLEACRMAMEQDEATRKAEAEKAGKGAGLAGEAREAAGAGEDEDEEAGSAGLDEADNIVPIPELAGEV